MITESSLKGGSGYRFILAGIASRLRVDPMLVATYDPDDLVELVEAGYSGHHGGDEVYFNGVRLTYRFMDDLVADLASMGYQGTPFDIGFIFEPGFAIFSIASLWALDLDANASEDDERQAVLSLGLHDVTEINARGFPTWSVADTLARCPSRPETAVLSLAQPRDRHVVRPRARKRALQAAPRQLLPPQTCRLSHLPPRRQNRLVAFLRSLDKSSCSYSGRSLSSAVICSHVTSLIRVRFRIQNAWSWPMRPLPLSSWWYPR